MGLFSTRRRINLDSAAFQHGRLRRRGRASIAARVHSRANYLREIAAAVQGGPIFLRRLYFRMDARGKRERRGAPLYKMCLRYSFRRARAAAPWKISYVHLREEEVQAGRDSVEKKKLRNPLA